MKNLPEWLKRTRERNSMTTIDVSKKLLEYGISKSHKTISGYENGRSMPDAYTLMAMCAIYGVEDIMNELGYKKEKAAPEESKGGMLLSMVAEKIGREPSVREMRLLANIFDGICEYLNADDE